MYVLSVLHTHKQNECTEHFVSRVCYGPQIDATYCTRDNKTGGG